MCDILEILIKKKKKRKRHLTVTGTGASKGRKLGLSGKATCGKQLSLSPIAGSMRQS